MLLGEDFKSVDLVPRKLEFWPCLTDKLLGYVWEGALRGEGGRELDLFLIRTL